MELLFATVIGAILGTIVNYTVPGRQSYGSALLPASAAAVTAAIWVALVWLGWTFDGTWIWVVSLVAGTAVSLVLALTLPNKRRTADENLLRSLSKA
jgi:small basic protein